MTHNCIEKPLSRLQALLKKKGSSIIHTSELARADREILVQHHWLEEIIRGWYLAIRPDLEKGDSTAWYANFWDFLNSYLGHNYGLEYCLSAECSLDVHVGSTTIPKQVIVMAQNGSGSPIQLPFDTSLLVYADPQRLPLFRETVRGLQVMPLAYAICKVSPAYFQLSSDDAKIALQLFHDPSELLHVLVENRFKNAAGRLIGAYRALNNAEMGDAIKKGLKDIGVNVQETNPFSREIPVSSYRAYSSPYVARLHALWEELRPVVLAHFPAPPGIPSDIKKYLKSITETYVQDAYNSLLIEGYRVTENIIQKVREAKWHPEHDITDRQHYDALAARGYYEAFLEVKDSVEKIIRDGNSGLIVTKDLPRWYQKLFHPLVQSGILSASDLFGYRRQQVYIRSSRHTPPPKEALSAAMETLFQLLQEEEHPAVRAILGHFIFVYIHPYMDGNGRMGRFLMNAMLASGGYPWTIIHVARRDEYMSALERASVERDILPFVTFVASEMQLSTVTGIHLA